MKISSIVTETTKNAPRPLNSFMGFRLEKQREILDKYPGINHRDISKITAKWWKEMSPNEKSYYKRKAEIAKTEHHKLYPDYRYTPKRKSVKTRVYKQRTDNNLTPAELKQKNNKLGLLYHFGVDAPFMKSDEESTTFSIQTKNSKSLPHQHDEICCAKCYSKIPLIEACSSPTSITTTITTPITKESTRSRSSTTVFSESVSPSPLEKQSSTSSGSDYYPTLFQQNHDDNTNVSYGSKTTTTLFQEPYYDPFHSSYNHANDTHMKIELPAITLPFHKNNHKNIRIPSLIHHLKLIQEQPHLNTSL